MQEFLPLPIGIFQTTNWHNKDWFTLVFLMLPIFAFWIFISFPLLRIFKDHQKQVTWLIEICLIISIIALFIPGIVSLVVNPVKEIDIYRDIVSLKYLDEGDIVKIKTSEIVDLHGRVHAEGCEITLEYKKEKDMYERKEVFNIYPKDSLKWKVCKS